MTQAVWVGLGEPVEVINALGEHIVFEAGDGVVLVRQTIEGEACRAVDVDLLQWLALRRDLVLRGRCLEAAALELCVTSVLVEQFGDLAALDWN